MHGTVQCHLLAAWGAYARYSTVSPSGCLSEVPMHGTVQCHLLAAWGAYARYSTALPKTYLRFTFQRHNVSLTGYGEWAVRPHISWIAVVAAGLLLGWYCTNGYFAIDDPPISVQFSWRSTRKEPGPTSLSDLHGHSIKCDCLCYVPPLPGRLQIKHLKGTVSSEMFAK
jgi:hypothetical protein